jgi:hypothetical protein
MSQPTGPTVRWRENLDQNRLFSFLLQNHTAIQLAEFIVIDHGDDERAAFARAQQNGGGNTLTPPEPTDPPPTPDKPNEGAN